MNRTPHLIAKHLIWKACYYFSVFCVNILIARILGAGSSGRVFYIINNLSFLLLILSGSIESGATYYAANGKLDARRVARFCLAWTVGATGTLLGGYFIFVKLFPAISSGTDRPLSVLLYATGVLMTTYFSALFFAKKQFKTPNLILSLVNISWAATLIIFNSAGWLQQHFLDAYFGIYFLQGLFICIAYFAAAMPQQTVSTQRPQPLSLLVRYSARALLANVLFFLVSRVDYWFVEKYCSANDLGNYIQASKLVQLFLVIPATVAATLFPIIASAGQYTEEPLRVITRMLLLFTVCSTVLLAIIGGWLFPLIFGSSFQQMYPLFLLLIPGIWALAIHYPLTAHFSGMNRISVNFTGAGIAVLAIAALDALLLPSFGVMIAAAVSSIGYICYLGYLLYVKKNDSREPIAPYFLFRRTDWAWFRQWIAKKIAS